MANTATGREPTAPTGAATLPDRSSAELVRQIHELNDRRAQELDRQRPDLLTQMAMGLWRLQ